MRKYSLARLASSCIPLFMLACGGNAAREATEGAVGAAESAVAGAQGDAAKYAPDQLSAAQSAMQSAKQALAKGDYPAALVAARLALEKAKTLDAAATEKKAQLSQDWAAYNETIPKALDEAKRRIDAFSHGAKRPLGIDDETLQEARTQHAALRQLWSDAVSAYQQGDLLTALQKASIVKEALPKLMDLLGINT